MKFISFGSIEQFRNVVKDVKHNAQYVGKDDNGDVVYDRFAEMPKIVATATEKIHGTNAAVAFNIENGLWVQSRNNIITCENDNAGCANAVNQNKEAWNEIISKMFKQHNLSTETLVIYFEWCGGNIQKKSAVTGLGKRSIIFKYARVVPDINADEENETSYWVDTLGIDSKSSDIFNISNFPSYEIEIDFERPDIAQNQLVELVEKTIEPNSPVGKQFGVDSNVGEGVVVQFMYKDKLYRFKVKGEEHSNSKVKTLKAVDSEKEQSKIDFATYACKAWRLEQMWQSVFGIENEKMTPDMKSVGLFLKAVMGDIVKEESDVLVEKGLEPKDISKAVNAISLKWFQEQLDAYAMS